VRRRNMRATTHGQDSDRMTLSRLVAPMRRGPDYAWTFVLEFGTFTFGLGRCWKQAGPCEAA